MRCSKCKVTHIMTDWYFVCKGHQNEPRKASTETYLYFSAIAGDIANQ